MKVGDRVVLSQEGRRALVPYYTHIDAVGTVVKPGVSRGGLRVRVIIDGGKVARTYAKEFWRKK